MNVSKYNKLWVALLAAVGVLVFACSPSELEPAFKVNPNEWFQVLAAFAGAFGVYQVRNKQ